MDDPENAAERLEAWSRWCERLYTGDDPILARLVSLRVRLEDLQQTFDSIADNDDVEAEIGPETPPPDFTREREAVSRFLDRARAELPAEMPEDGWNDYQEAVRRASGSRASPRPTRPRTLPTCSTRSAAAGRSRRRRAGCAANGDAPPRDDRHGSRALAEIPAPDRHARGRPAVAEFALAPAAGTPQLQDLLLLARNCCAITRSSAARSRRDFFRSSSTTFRTRIRSRPRSSST